MEGLRIYPSIVSVPYRFPRGTVLVDRTAYRTFSTVFRDFCLKARTLLRFKFYRSSVLTLIFRKSANRNIMEGLRIYPSIVSVPYRFPRGTVLVDRTAYRTFSTVFRDFCLKARTLPRFKFYRSSVLTLIFRKSANRTVPKLEPFFVILTLKTFDGIY
jgi:hypothetical protein